MPPIALIRLKPAEHSTVSRSPSSASVLFRPAFGLIPAALLALVLLIVGCKSDPAASAPPPVPPVTLQVGQSLVEVQVAADEPARLLHLQRKNDLPDNQGMLLVFQSDDHFKISTNDLKLYLDVILLDADGKVLDIKPISRTLADEFESPVAARYALMVRRGLAERSGVKAGDVIALPPAVTALSEPTRIPLKLGNGTVRVEIVASDKLRQRGLMFRTSLPADAGMVFVFDREQDLGFWMKDTRIPLDIVYLDRNGRIVSIRHMAPFDTSRVGSGGPAKFAIELNLGKAAELGLQPGQHVELPDAIRNPPGLEP